jgi:hypothetical protein
MSASTAAQTLNPADLTTSGMLIGGLGGGCSGGWDGAEKRGASGRLLLGSSGAGMVGNAFGASGAFGRSGICARITCNNV